MTTLTGALVELRPLVEPDAAALREIMLTPKVARWWNLANEHADWPFEPAGGSHRFAVRECGRDEVIGMVQYWEEDDPQYRHAGIDIVLDPRKHGHGLGTDAVRTMARHLFDAVGHHRVTIDPATANAAAVRCYEKVGFRRVGIMRRYERDHQTGAWRDGQLMDLLAEDLT